MRRTGGKNGEVYGVRMGAGAASLTGGLMGKQSVFYIKSVRLAHTSAGAGLRQQPYSSPRSVPPCGAFLFNRKRSFLLNKNKPAPPGRHTNFHFQIVYFPNISPYRPRNAWVLSLAEENTASGAPSSTMTPSAMKITRSEMSLAKAISWVTITMVMS